MSEQTSQSPKRFGILTRRSELKQAARLLGSYVKPGECEEYDHLRRSPTLYELAEVAEAVEALQRQVAELQAENAALRVQVERHQRWFQEDARKGACS